MIIVLFLAYFFSFSDAAPDKSCLTPEFKKLAATCVEGLNPLFAELQKPQNNEAEKIKLINLCENSLNCFKSIEKCAEIPKEIIDSAENICSLTKFLNSPQFSPCVEIIDSKKDKCSRKLFIGSEQIKGDRKEKCEIYKTNGDCARKFISSSCSKEALKAFETFRTERTKRLKC
ncbi:unnamed protein product [Caenorhabditis angaria]|uniref:T20D4.11-like domain-containing protein n=1 Tax=Caenorhabditis angaria TaxID=860376 RepID=A0A9P1IV36_9PELO|nr:unnamed protein product [Caenorhabditis angaria]